LGGFGSRAEAQGALRNKLARLVPDRRSATRTLGEWVDEYLEAHQGERVTVAKLRWLLGKATAELGEVRLAELSPEQVCAWRLTVQEGHRPEATFAEPSDGLEPSTPSLPSRASERPAASSRSR
jgi:hypothetical protein